MWRERGGGRKAEEEIRNYELKIKNYNDLQRIMELSGPARSYWWFHLACW
jgi:hypothetical protein